MLRCHQFCRALAVATHPFVCASAPAWPRARQEESAGHSRARPQRPVTPSRATGSGRAQGGLLSGLQIGLDEAGRRPVRCCEAAPGACGPACRPLPTPPPRPPSLSQAQQALAQVSAARARDSSRREWYPPARRPVPAQAAPPPAARDATKPGRTRPAPNKPISRSSSLVARTLCRAAAWPRAGQDESAGHS